MKVDSVRAALRREGGRRRDGSAPCREGRDGHILEKEMSQTQWWVGRALRRGGRDPRAEDNAAGEAYSQTMPWNAESSPNH